MASQNSELVKYIGALCLKSQYWEMCIMTLQLNVSSVTLYYYMSMSSVHATITQCIITT